MAAPLTFGHAHAEGEEYTRLPTTTFFPWTVSFLANHWLVCNGWWFMVINAEEVVVGLGDGLAGPVTVDVTGVKSSR